MLDKKLSFVSSPLKLEDTVRRKIQQASQTWRERKKASHRWDIFIEGLEEARAQAGEYRFKGALESIRYKRSNA